MTDKHHERVTFKGFVNQFMAITMDKFAFSANSIQIYPLSMAPAGVITPSPLFRAEYNFLLLITEGGGKQQIDNTLFDLYPNDILFIREGHLNAIHSIEANTDGYFIYMESRLLPQLFADSNLLHRFTFHPKHSVSGADLEWLGNCCELLLNQQNTSPHAEAIRVVLLRAIWLKLAEASAAARSRPDRPSEITMLFKERLYEHFSTNRDVAFYADSLAVSENYLNRCVNRATNKPPKQHINEMVIIHSKLLLQDRSKDIAQVAFALNFSDPSYFGRFFKQLTGQTPSEYRNTLTQDLSGYRHDF
ncbi:AraC family transcriptional regulator [Fibrisoma montanum]|uniref:AraC family transcriptional regulator n=1 Tax=Fibrisoma montanum TaxID=2305895 RepID=A0A418ME61_9BACT|nr:helix-turn-helix transcriptional regulator [Fibrisoma montanum]RIV25071.1 AraC family transcriptional regulator [Fibrisoma montanum]